MAIQQLVLDPNAQAYTDDEIVGKVNAATADITRAQSVAGAAIVNGEVDTAQLAGGAVDNTILDTGVAKANLDAMADLARGYVKTDPTTGQFPVIAVQRASDGKLEVDYDDVAI